MSVFVRLEEKKFGSDNARGKWYAKMVRMGEVGVDELAEQGVIDIVQSFLDAQGDAGVVDVL